jgi:acid stress chaperone HdeA
VAPGKNNWPLVQYGANARALMSCDDFVVLEDAYKPQVVYSVDCVNKKGKMQKEHSLMVGQDETIVALLEECKKTPSSPSCKR